jgi:hypothetical protein
LGFAQKPRLAQKQRALVPSTDHQIRTYGDKIGCSGHLAQKLLTNWQFLCKAMIVDKDLGRMAARARGARNLGTQTGRLLVGGQALSLKLP